MKELLSILLIGFVPFLGKAQENGLVDSLIITIKAEQKEALNNADTLKLKEIATRLDRLSSFGEKEWLIDYYLAYNYYSMCNLTQDKKEKGRYIEEAKKMIEKSINKKDDFSESHAFYSSILGMEIGLKPYLGMKNGIKSGKEIEKAHKLEPNNPRVYIIEGISAIHTPALFGGGIDKALEKLNRAVELFQKEKEDRGIYPDWGRDEVFIWLGITYEKKEEKDKALLFFKKALEVNPDNGWAKHLIEEMK